jgi:C-terminal processing protease CtpA/Prc
MAMYRFSSSLLMLILTAALPVWAADAVPPPPNASTADSYQYLRALRAEAQRLSTPRQATSDDLARALIKYRAALDYLATPPVAERASGFAPMQAEYINLWIPMAASYARLGQKEQALSALEHVVNAMWASPFVDAFSAPDFDSLRDEPRFKAIMNTSALPKRLYQPIATPYKPVLSTEEKVAGLSMFWAEARREFAHFDHVPDLDWNQVYMTYLSKVIAAPTTLDYYRIMMQLAPLLQDGHTNIYAPEDLADTFYARPPLRTMLVEDKVLVERVADASLAARVHIGDEIVAIDGHPVKQYADQYVVPFVSASTPQDRAVRAYGYQLLAGEVQRPLTLRLRDAAGNERVEVVARGGASQGSKQFVYRMLPGQIAYLSLDQFETDAGVKSLELALPEIFKAKGLILDVRRNGGGSSNNGYAVLSYLSRGPVATSLSYVRADDPTMRAQGGGAVLWRAVPWSGEAYRMPRKEVFSGPVAVLASAQTFSAAEDFLVAFRAMKRGPIVGEASGGSTGQPLFFALPGGGTARICVKRDLAPDGTAFVGTGVLPDVEAHPTVAGIRANSDPVLERALAELGKR